MLFFSDPCSNIGTASEQAIGISGTIHQSCGTANFEITRTPPPPKLLAPICGTSGRDVYERGVIYDRVQAVCKFVVGKRYTWDSDHTDKRLEDSPVKTIMDPFKPIRNPRGGKSALRLLFEADIRGCAPDQIHNGKFSVDFSRFTTQECVAAWMTTVDGCKSPSVITRYIFR